MKLFRASVVLAGLAGTFAVSSCIQDDNKPQIVKVANAKTKDIIDVERIELKKKEGAFVHQLDNWSSLDVSAALLHLEVGTDDKAKEEFFDKTHEDLRFLRSDFLDERIGNEKPDFRTNPSEKQVKLFIIVLRETDKAAGILEPYMKLPVNEIIEKHAKNLNKHTEKLYVGKNLREVAEELFTLYKKDLPKLAEKKAELIQALETFNKDAEIAGQAIYEPTWGLSLELLKSLKSIK